MLAALPLETMMLSALLRRLDEEGLSLIIMADGKTVFSSNKDGMVPLLEAIDKIGASRLSGSVVVVDKIVGKAAALLICVFKAQKVYTKMMSVKAIKMLDDNSIEYSAGKIIPEILNKTGTDICPFEKAVSETDDPEEGNKRLRELVKKLKLYP